jgi:hypothetical protein
MAGHTDKERKDSLNSLDSFVKKQVSTLVRQPRVRTTGGQRASTYSSPTAIIRDTGVFAKAFMSTFEKLYEPPDFSAYDSDDLPEVIDNTILAKKIKDYADSDKYKGQYERDVARNKFTEADGSLKALNNIGNAANGLNNLTALQSDSAIDASASNLEAPDESGKGSGITSEMLVEINNKFPQDIDPGEKNGVQGFFIKTSKINKGLIALGKQPFKDEQVFVATSLITPKWIEKNTSVAIDAISAINSKGTEAILKNRDLKIGTGDTYSQDDNIEVRTKSGALVQVKTDKSKYITDGYYSKAEEAANAVVNSIFPDGIKDSRLKSGLAELMRAVKAGSYLPENIKSDLEELDIDISEKGNDIYTNIQNAFSTRVGREKSLELVQKYFTNEFLINKAAAAYKRDEETGTAVKVNEIFATQELAVRAQGGSGDNKEQKQLNLFNEEMRKGGLETLLKNYAEGGEAKLAEGIADFMNDKIGIEVPIEQVVEKDEKGNDKIVKNQLRLKPPGLREFTINLSTNTPTEIIQGLQYAIIGDPDLLRSANIGTEQSLFPNSAAKNLIQRIRLEKKEEEENN